MFISFKLNRKHELGLLLYIISMLYIAGLFSCGSGEISREKEARIIRDTQSVVEMCNIMNPADNIPIKGKILVYNTEPFSRSLVNSSLPTSLKASESDEHVTVLYISPEKELLGYYSITNQPGYRLNMKIYVVYWPENKPAGIHLFKGPDPRHSRPVERFNPKPETGDFTKKLIAWINIQDKLR